MDVKEFIFSALAIALGFIVASIVLKKLPPSIKGTWESSYEDTYEDVG
jgi:hypothetical protein